MDNYEKIEKIGEGALAGREEETARGRRRRERERERERETERRELSKHDAVACPSARLGSARHGRSMPAAIESGTRRSLGLSPGLAVPLPSRQRRRREGRAPARFAGERRRSSSAAAAAAPTAFLSPLTPSLETPPNHTQGRTARCTRPRTSRTARSWR
jgi:hypothetical protein